MAEESPRVKALTAYLMASPHDSDRKWAEYVALTSDHAGFLATKRSSAKDGLTPEARRNYDYLVSGGTTLTKDDLTPEARRNYDYLVGDSAVLAPAVSEVSTVLQDPKVPNVSPIAVDINSAELSALTPTACSVKCPSHDVSVSVAELISAATSTSPSTCSTKCLRGDTSEVPTPLSPTAVPTTSAATLALPATVSATADVTTVLRVPTEIDVSHDAVDIDAPTSSTPNGGVLSELAPPEVVKKVSNAAMTATVPRPPPSCSCKGTLLIHGQNLFHNAQQKRGTEFLVVWVMRLSLPALVQDVQNSQRKHCVNWLDIREDRHPFERIEVVKLKPPWLPYFGMSMNLPTGHFVLGRHSPTLIDVGVCLKLEQLTIAKFAALMYTFSHTATLHHHFSSGILTLLNTATSNSAMVPYIHCKRPPDAAESDCSVSRYFVAVYTSRLEEGQMKPTMFEWSDPFCSDTHILIRSTNMNTRLAWLLARRAASIVWNWLRLDNLDFCRGSTNGAIPHGGMGMFVSSRETWVLLNCHSARLQIQLIIGVQGVLTDAASKGGISHHILRGTTYSELMQWSFNNSILQSEFRLCIPGHMLFLCCELVQMEISWTINLVSLQFWFQYCRAGRESRHGCEKFQWIIAWFPSYYFSLYCLRTRSACVSLLMEQNYPAIYKEPLFRHILMVLVEPCSCDVPDHDYKWLMLWSTTENRRYEYPCNWDALEVDLVLVFFLKSLVSCYLTSQGHSEVIKWYMECTTLIHYLEIEMKSLAVYSISLLHLQWDPGGFTQHWLRFKPKIRGITWLFMAPCWIIPEFGRSGTVTTSELSFWRYPLSLVNQMVLKIYHSFSAKDVIEVGLLIVISVQDLFLPCSNREVTQYGSADNQWKIAWSLNMQDFYSGSTFGQLSCGNTLQVPLSADWSQCYSTISTGCPCLTSSKLNLSLEYYHLAYPLLYLPWDPGDCSVSAWRRSKPRTVDFACYLSAIDTSQVPWDPGGWSRDRLGDKPNFMEGGLSATNLYSRLVWMVWAATPGPGLLGNQDKEGTRDIYEEDTKEEGWLGTNGLDGGFGRGLAWRVLCVLLGFPFFLLRSSPLFL